MSDILSDCVESENFRGLDLFLYWWEQQVQDIKGDPEFTEDQEKVKKNNEALIRFDPTNETIKPPDVLRDDINNSVMLGESNGMMQFHSPPGLDEPDCNKQ